MKPSLVMKTYGATSGRTREEALKNINEVVHIIVQELSMDQLDA
jgi:hypothetical protein